MFTGCGVLASGDCIKTDLELRVDNPGLRCSPLSTVLVTVDVSLPLLDGFAIFFLVEEELRDLEERLTLEFLEILRGRDARCGIGCRCFLIGNEFEVFTTNKVTVSGDGLVSATKFKKFVR